MACLLEETRRRPVLVVWEDLHWADPSTLELLGLVIDQAPMAPMVILMSFRPEFRPKEVTHSHLTQITLGRLGRHQVAQIVAHLTHGKTLPAEVLEQVIAKTDGVPLFVEELIKMVLESGLVHEAEDHYVLTGQLPLWRFLPRCRTLSWPAWIGLARRDRWPNSAPRWDESFPMRSSRPWRRWMR